MKTNIMLSVGILLASCGGSTQNQVFVVRNSLSFNRESEVVKIQLELEAGEKTEDYALVSQEGNLQLIQFIDENRDGSADAILFQPKVDANSETKYTLMKKGAQEENPKSDNACFSRFVPERTDDYAWENDRVAFRMFGPTAQQMKENDVPGGTLTSGIDCWLKKVEYPIINSWYKKYEIDPNGYHVDTGEGLDNFHVGLSRGCGGIAVERDGKFYSPKNFTDYQTLVNGYMQTAFHLDYAPWVAGDSTEVKTSNTISLDRGSNLSRIEVSAEETNIIWSGLTMHENDGEVTVDSLSGWVTYWQPHGDSYLGMAIIADPGTFMGHQIIQTTESDLSHVYVKLAVIEGKAVYYAGFSWQESGQYESKETWNNYIKQRYDQLKNPLLVTQGIN